MSDLAAPEAGFAQLPDGGRIAYTVFGRPARAAPPLLLLRPLGGSMALWGPFRDRLATARRVIAFDPRGAGRSTQAPRFTTTRKMAADAIALLDHLGIEEVDLFGLSLGGMVATRFAIGAPARLRRLVLGSTARRGLDISRHGLGRAMSLGQCLLHRDMAEVEACLVQRILSARFRAEHPDEVRRMTSLVRLEPASRLGMLRLVGAAAMHDARGQLERVRAPTLLLWGKLDPLLRYDSQRELQRAIPDARIEIIPDCGHDLTLEQPLATAERIDAFLSRT